MATAKETYKQRQAEIKQQLKSIEAALKKHAEAFKTNDKNWGYVGDLSHIKSNLNHSLKILEFQI